ncbi:ribonuclease M5 [Halobacteroides halobius DSM 5150]|uniref:Ribonuclease M5 n=1 Tax=Halobacteroides halobius (strain ATCC 35273 / DSM 5150 / MD-1) TaxID=748449 RepID=L0K6D5_HALHC|nr:ribonuclease M5 [Halobacteroides halobius]AGB40100.1 ribonuclease M5 [Halobacteroides halobius DSM 5150]
MIKEVIVVEGRDDVDAVKKAVDAELIITGGFSLGEEVLDRIRLAQERKGVIIFTDPDHAGELIRKRIKQEVSGCKDAYLSQAEAIEAGDIGIENAPPQVIREALNKAQVEDETRQKQFDKQDLVQLGLLGNKNAKNRRELVGKRLGIGYANGKQFLSRLNNYGISPQELVEAVEREMGGNKNGVR